MKRMVLFCATVTMALLLMVCLQSATAQTSKKADKPVSGGTLQIAVLTEPTTQLSTEIRATHDVALASFTLETLMQYDEKGIPQPWLLESITGDPEKKIYTLKVRKGIKFTDGTDLNADTVKWNLDMYKKKGVLSSSFYGLMESTEKVDDYTVLVHMSSWDSLFPYALARSCVIASKQAYETKGEEWCRRNPVGTGPFILKTWEHGVGLSYVKNPGYWKGTSYLDGVKCTIYSNELVMQAAMLAGEIHVMKTTDIKLADSMRAKGFRGNKSSVPASAYTICFNSSDPKDPFHDVRVRQAASHAIDKQGIIDTLCKGYGIDSNQWAVKNSMYYNDAISGYSYNLQKAKELLTQAGYPNGFSTKITLPSLPLLKDTVQIIAEQLAKVGIKAEIRAVEDAAYFKYIGSWEEGMLLHPMGMVNGTASQIAANFVQGLKAGLGIVSMIRPDDVHKLIMEARAAGPEISVKKFKEVQKLIFDDYCMMKTIFIIPSIGIESPKLNDGGFCQVVDGMHTFYKAWLEK